VQLVDVVLQGVTGAPRAVRWVPAASGVSVIPAGEAEGLFGAALFEVLAVVAEGVVPAAVLPDADGQGRAAVVVIGRDDRRYRLLWDLHTGRRALQLHNGTAWEMVTTTSSEVASSLTASLGFPQADVLREVFIGLRDDLPSRRAERGAATTSGKADKPLPPGFGDASAADTSGKPLPPGFDFNAGPAASRFAGKPEHELRARLAEIAALGGPKVDVAALEFELDGLQKKTFELQAKRKPVADAETALRTVTDQLKRVAFLDALPSDFLEQARRLSTIKAEHERELGSIDNATSTLVASASHLSEEVSGLTRRGGPRPVQAALDDPLVRWGSVAGIAAIAVAFFGHYVVDGLRWVALLDIPAFAAAAFGGIRLLGGLEEGASVRMKLMRYSAERKRLVDRFEIDREQIDRLLERNQLTFEQLPEMEQHYAVRANLLARKAEHDAVIAELGSQMADVDAELAANTDRIRVVEGELQNAGNGYDPALAELQREAAEIEEVLRGERVAAPSPAKSEPPAPVPSGKFGAGGPVDVLQKLVRVAADLLVLSIEDTAARLAPRAGQMLQALTDRRFSGLQFGARGEGSVVDATDQSVLPFVQLPGIDRDLVVLALKLAVVEAAGASSRVPVVFDRTLDHFPVEKAPLLVRALQVLGSNNQVVVVTKRRELAAAGTVVTAQTAQG
jgi:hypothetical protein